jgi:septum formation protein
MKKLILASGSPRRSELLKQMGLSFEVVLSQVDEKPDLELKAEDIAQDLAMEKAQDVLNRIIKIDKTPGENDSETIIIAADTIVVKDGILGKPKDESDAFEMLKSLQDGWHDVITGIAVIDLSNISNGYNTKTAKCFERTRVKMRKLSDTTIWSYIKTGESMDKAGAYGIQGLGAILIERIEGDYFNVVGLPLTKLDEILKGFNVIILE